MHCLHIAMAHVEIDFPCGAFNMLTIFSFSGLYINEEDNQAPERFRGLGIRIEDDVVIRQKGGPLILSSEAPKTIADVEQACAQR